MYIFRSIAAMAAAIRLTADPSLVHIDTWRRYIRDFLKACRYIKKAHPDLSLNLYAHSMGGAIGGIGCSLGAGLVSQGDPFFSDDPSSYR